MGTTSAQTLSNKTLTNPTINSATLTGTIAGNSTFTGTQTGDTGARIRLNNVNDVTLASTNHAFQIGLDSGANIRMDNNEILAVTNGVASNLTIQADGGTVAVNTSLAVDNTTLAINANGSINANLLQISRALTSSSVSTVKTDADAQFRFTQQADGSMAWGSGSAATDTTLTRSGSARLTVGSNLTVTSNTTTGTLTTTGLATLNSASVATTLGVTGTSTLGVTNVTDLTVTGNTVFPVTTATGTSVATAAAGFTIAAATVGYKTQGYTTVNVVWTRTGAAIVADAQGNIADTLAFALLSAYRPNAAFGTERISVAFNTGGTAGGTVGLNPSTGQVELLTLNSNATLGTGEIGRVTFTFPSV